MAVVVGGFHSPQIAQLLREQKISYVIVSPKITKVTDEAGSSYLSVFAREKTPLDQIFKGEQLFLSPTDGHTTSYKLFVPLLAALSALQTHLNPVTISWHAKKIVVRVPENITRLRDYAYSQHESFIETLKAIWDRILGFNPFDHIEFEPLIVWVEAPGGFRWPHLQNPHLRIMMSGTPRGDSDEADSGNPAVNALDLELPQEFKFDQKMVADMLATRDADISNAVEENPSLHGWRNSVHGWENGINGRPLTEGPLIERLSVVKNMHQMNGAAAFELLQKIQIYLLESHQFSLPITFRDLSIVENGKMPTLFYRDEKLLSRYRLTSVITATAHSMHDEAVLTEFFFIEGFCVGYGVTKFMDASMSNLDMQFNIFQYPRIASYGRGKIRGLSAAIYNTRLDLLRAILPAPAFIFIGTPQILGHESNPKFYLDLGFTAQNPSNTEGKPDYLDGLRMTLFPTETAPSSIPTRAVEIYQEMKPLLDQRQKSAQFKSLADELIQVMPEALVEQHISRLDDGHSGVDEYRTYTGLLKTVAGLHERVEILALSVDAQTPLSMKLDTRGNRFHRDIFLPAHDTASSMETTYLSIDAEQKGYGILSPALLRLMRPADVGSFTLMGYDILHQAIDLNKDVLRKGQGVTATADEAEKAFQYFVDQKLLLPSMTQPALTRNKIFSQFIYFKMMMEFKDSQLVHALGSEWLFYVVYQVCNALGDDGSFFQTHPSANLAQAENVVRQFLTQAEEYSHSPQFKFMGRRLSGINTTGYQFFLKKDGRSFHLDFTLTMGSGDKKELYAYLNTIGSGSQGDRLDTKVPANTVANYYTDNPIYAFLGMAGEIAVILSSIVFGNPVMTYSLLIIIYSAHFVGWRHAAKQNRAPPLWSAIVSHTMVFLAYALAYHQTDTLNLFVLIPVVLQVTVDLYFLSKPNAMKIGRDSVFAASDTDSPSVMREDPLRRGAVTLAAHVCKQENLPTSAAEFLVPIFSIKDGDSSAYAEKMAEAFGIVVIPLFNNQSNHASSALIFRPTKERGLKSTTVNGKKVFLMGFNQPVGINLQGRLISFEELRNISTHFMRNQGFHYRNWNIAFVSDTDVHGEAVKWPELLNQFPKGNAFERLWNKAFPSDQSKSTEHLEDAMWQRVALHELAHVMDQILKRAPLDAAPREEMSACLQEVALGPNSYAGLFFAMVKAGIDDNDYGVENAKAIDALFELGVEKGLFSRTSFQKIQTLVGEQTQRISELAKRVEALMDLPQDQLAVLAKETFLQEFGYEPYIPVLENFESVIPNSGSVKIPTNWSDSLKPAPMTRTGRDSLRGAVVMLLGGVALALGGLGLRWNRPSLPDNPIYLSFVSHRGQDMSLVLPSWQRAIADAKRRNGTPRILPVIEFVNPESPMYVYLKLKGMSLESGKNRDLTVQALETLWDTYQSRPDQAARMEQIREAIVPGERAQFGFEKVIRNMSDPEQKEFFNAFATIAKADGVDKVVMEHSSFEAELLYAISIAHNREAWAALRRGDVTEMSNRFIRARQFEQKSHQKRDVLLGQQLQRLRKLIPQTVLYHWRGYLHESNLQNISAGAPVAFFQSSGMNEFHKLVDVNSFNNLPKGEHTRPVTLFLVLKIMEANKFSKDLSLIIIDHINRELLPLDSAALEKWLQDLVNQINIEAKGKGIESKAAFENIIRQRGYMAPKPQAAVPHSRREWIAKWVGVWGGVTRSGSTFELPGNASVTPSDSQKSSKTQLLALLNNVFLMPTIEEGLRYWIPALFGWHNPYWYFLIYPVFQATFHLRNDVPRWGWREALLRQPSHWAFSFIYASVYWLTPLEWREQGYEGVLPATLAHMGVNAVRSFISSVFGEHLLSRVIPMSSWHYRGNNSRAINAMAYFNLRIRGTTALAEETTLFVQIDRPELYSLKPSVTIESRRKSFIFKRDGVIRNLRDLFKAKAATSPEFISLLEKLEQNIPYLTSNGHALDHEVWKSRYLARIEFIRLIFARYEAHQKILKANNPVGFEISIPGSETTLSLTRDQFKKLSPMEKALLDLSSGLSGRVFTTEEILETIWVWDLLDDDEHLDPLSTEQTDQLIAAAVLKASKLKSKQEKGSKTGSGSFVGLWIGMLLLIFTHGGRMHAATSQPANPAISDRVEHKLSEKEKTDFVVNELLVTINNYYSDVRQKISNQESIDQNVLLLQYFVPACSKIFKAGIDPQLHYALEGGRPMLNPTFDLLSRWLQERGVFFRNMRQDVSLPSGKIFDNAALFIFADIIRKESKIFMPEGMPAIDARFIVIGNNRLPNIMHVYGNDEIATASAWADHVQNNLIVIDERAVEDLAKEMWSVWNSRARQLSFDTLKKKLGEESKKNVIEGLIFASFLKQAFNDNHFQSYDDFRRVAMDFKIRQLELHEVSHLLVKERGIVPFVLAPEKNRAWEEELAELMPIAFGNSPDFGLYSLQTWRTTGLPDYQLAFTNAHSAFARTMLRETNAFSSPIKNPVVNSGIEGNLIRLVFLSPGEKRELARIRLKQLLGPYVGLFDLLDKNKTPSSSQKDKRGVSKRPSLDSFSPLSTKSPANTILGYYTDNPVYSLLGMAGEIAIILSSMMWGNSLMTYSLITVIFGGHYFGWQHATKQGRAPPAWLAFLSHTTVFLSYALAYHHADTLNLFVLVPVVLQVVGDLFFVLKPDPLRTGTDSLFRDKPSSIGGMLGFWKNWDFTNPEKKSWAPFMIGIFEGLLGNALFFLIMGQVMPNAPNDIFLNPAFYLVIFSNPFFWLSSFTISFVLHFIFGAMNTRGDVKTFNVAASLQSSAIAMFSAIPVFGPLIHGVLNSSGSARLNELKNNGDASGPDLRSETSIQKMILTMAEKFAHQKADPRVTGRTDYKQGLLMKEAKARPFKNGSSLFDYLYSANTEVRGRKALTLALQKKSFSGDAARVRHTYSQIVSWMKTLPQLNDLTAIQVGNIVYTVVTVLTGDRDPHSDLDARTVAEFDRVAPQFDTLLGISTLPTSDQAHMTTGAATMLTEALTLAAMASVTDTLFNFREVGKIPGALGFPAQDSDLKDENTISFYLDRVHSGVTSSIDVNWQTSDMIPTKLLKLGIILWHTKLRQKETQGHPELLAWIQAVNAHPEKPILFIPDDKEDFVVVQSALRILLRSGFHVIMADEAAPNWNNAWVDWLQERVDQDEELTRYKKSGHLSVMSTGSNLAGTDLTDVSPAFNETLLKVSGVLYFGESNDESFRSAPPDGISQEVKVPTLFARVSKQERFAVEFHGNESTTQFSSRPGRQAREDASSPKAPANTILGYGKGASLSPDSLLSRIPTLRRVNDNGKMRWKLLTVRSHMAHYFGGVWDAYLNDYLRDLAKDDTWKSRPDHARIEKAIKAKEQEFLAAAQAVSPEVHLMASKIIETFLSGSAEKRSQLQKEWATFDRGILRPLGFHGILNWSPGRVHTYPLSSIHRINSGKIHQTTEDQATLILQGTSITHGGGAPIAYANLDQNLIFINEKSLRKEANLAHDISENRNGNMVFPLHLLNVKNSILSLIATSVRGRSRAQNYQEYLQAFLIEELTHKLHDYKHVQYPATTDVLHLRENIWNTPEQTYIREVMFKEISGLLANLVLADRPSVPVASIVRFIFFGRNAGYRNAGWYVLNKLSGKDPSQWIDMGDYEGLISLALALMERPDLRSQAKDIYDQLFPGVGMISLAGFSKKVNNPHHPSGPGMGSGKNVRSGLFSGVFKNGVVPNLRSLPLKSWFNSGLAFLVTAFDVVVVENFAYIRSLLSSLGKWIWLFTAVIFFYVTPMTVNAQVTELDNPAAMEIGAKQMATVLVALSQNKVADAIIGLQGLEHLDIGAIRNSAPSPFIQRWDLWSQDPEFMMLLRSQVREQLLLAGESGQLKAGSVDINELMMLVMQQAGLTTYEVPKLASAENTNTPRVFVMQGLENANVLIAAVLRSGLQKPTRFLVEDTNESRNHYGAIAAALTKLGADITIVTYEDRSNAGIDQKGVFHRTLVTKEMLPQGLTAKDVIFVLAKGIDRGDVLDGIIPLSDLVPDTMRANLDKLDVIMRRILTAA